jgi:hypothetical protein
MGDYYRDFKGGRELGNDVARLRVYANSMCLDEMVPLEDHMEKLVVVDVFESCPCVCIYIRWC